MCQQGTSGNTKGTHTTRFVHFSLCYRQMLMGLGRADCGIVEHGFLQFSTHRFGQFSEHKRL